MKIVHVMSYFQPKLGYQEYYLALKQQEFGHEVYVLTSDRNYPYPGYNTTYEPTIGKRLIGDGVFMECGIKVIRLPCLVEYGDQILVNNAFKTLVKLRPDVIHVHDVFSQLSFISFMLKKMLNCLVVMDCHSDYTTQSKSYLRHFGLNLLSMNPFYRLMIKNISGYIAISESSRQWLLNQFDLNSGEIEIIPLGADKELFFPNINSRKFFRKKLGLTNNDILLVCAGKILPSKDIDVLLDAIRPIISKYNNIQILFIGSGPEHYIQKLHFRINKLKLSKHIIFRGFMDKSSLPNYYNAADIGIWPGLDSLTILEAMAVGLPVVIPKSSRNSHYLAYSNGFNFQRGNVEELTSVLEKLVIDEHLRRLMGNRSRKLVEDRLNWDAITTSTLNFYSEKASS